jgi:hypothetical protein
MRPLFWWSSVALAIGLVGCSDAPYCSEFVDMTGRSVAFCPSPRADPVCDRPGEEAHFEMSAGGFMLVGGDYARCSVEEVVTCPMGTVGVPYCVTDPEL